MNGTPTISTTKLEAARRQTDAAVRMHFCGEDPFAIHTIAAAALRILRDISEQQGGNAWHDGLKASIKPGMENAFWKAMNKAANFLKHADHDPAAELGVGEDINDWTIVGCCSYYGALGLQLTPEMRAFLGWHMARYPDVLVDSPIKTLLKSEHFKWAQEASRAESLKHGTELLAAARDTVAQGRP